MPKAPGPLISASSSLSLSLPGGGKDAACIGAEILVSVEKLHRNGSLCISYMKDVMFVVYFFSVPNKVRFFQLV